MSLSVHVVVLVYWSLGKHRDRKDAAGTYTKSLSHVCVYEQQRGRMGVQSPSSALLGASNLLAASLRLYLGGVGKGIQIILARMQ